MTTGSADSPLGAHPFLRHSSGQESRNQKPHLKSAATLSAARWAYTECFPFSEAVRAVSETVKSYDRYCALALCLDISETAKRAEMLNRVVMTLIQRIQTDHGAVGGRWDGHLYFMALPGIGMPAARRIAEKLQTDLAAQRPETVSIGIAPFPLPGYGQQHTWANAVKALAHAAYLGPASIVELDAVTLNISGDHQYQRGAIKHAIEEYRAALDLDPEDTNVLNSLGVCLAEANDTAAAKHAFKTAAELDPAEPMARYNLGMLYLLDQNREKALDQFQQAQASNHEFFEVPYQIGLLLCRQCRWEEALAYAEKALSLNQAHGSLYGLKGECLAALEQTSQAITAYTRSIKINPNNADSLSALGCLYDKKNENPDICRSFFKQSVTLAPDNGLFHYRLGRWYHKQQRWEEAKTAYEAAMEKGYDASRRLNVLEKELNMEASASIVRTG